MLTRYDRQGRLIIPPWHRDPVWRMCLCACVVLLISLACCKACDEMPVPCDGPACEVLR